MARDTSGPSRVCKACGQMRKPLKGCREELREVLEEWIVLGLKMGHMLPEIDGVTLNIQEVA